MKKRSDVEPVFRPVVLHEPVFLSLGTSLLIKLRRKLKRTVKTERPNVL
jgi:hypothetical protein